MGIVMVDGRKLPKDAVRIHPYRFEDILRPRGTMKKESLGEHILERLEGAYEQWSNGEYGDNPEVTVLLQYLHQNLMGEVQNAWREFTTRRCIKDVSD